MTERLPEDLARALSVARPRLGAFSAVRYAAEVDSTNDIAIELAQAGASHGTAVLADAQRAGRGRRGRVWFSPPGAGVYLSAVVRPPAAMAAPLSLVTLAAGVATARAVAAATGLTSELKWPNDLVVGRPWRKLGGILCEAVGVGPSVDAIVLGVGLNLQHTAYPLDVAAATSIEDELGRAVDRPAVVVELSVPPLRKRRLDILPLARVLLTEAALRLNRSIKPFCIGLPGLINSSSTLFSSGFSMSTFNPSASRTAVPLSSRSSVWSVKDFVTKEKVLPSASSKVVVC